MDWLRRNWPDLLIGVALVAVIAGIIATLISGGSFFPFGQGGGSTPTPQPSTPITGTTTPGTTQPGVAQPGAAQPGATQPGATPGQAGSTEPGATTPGSEQPGTEDSPIAPEIPTNEGIAVLPPAGTPGGTGTTPATPPSTTPATPGGSASGTGGVTALPPAGATPSTPSATTPSTPSTPTAPSTPSTPSATPGTPVAASADADEASYRVSVGAFGNTDNAQRLAEQFQGAGYPVLLGSQGNLTIVLLGPYATDSEARQVANQVDGSFGVIDPTVYRFEPEEGVGSAPAAAAPTTQPATPAATPAATPTPAPATSATGRYLQVGAYANRESSLPQRDRLEGLGFTVTEAQEGDLLKLLVGPYQGASLTDAQSRLAAEGIENFARGL